MNISKLLSESEREENPAFTEAELAQFLWDVREQRAIMGVKREHLLRFFTTLAEAQEGFTMIKNQFVGGVCPDCQEPIPNTMQDGGECSNCGHIFYDTPWDDNFLQFARLLAEIRAVGLTAEQTVELKISMDLSTDSICEIMSRAEEAYETAKQGL